MLSVFTVQDEGEQLIWQEKVSSSLTTHTASSGDKAARTIGPRLQVSAMLCLYFQCKYFLQRCYASVVLVIALSICLSICLSYASILLKWWDILNWFWHGGFLPPILHYVIRTFEYF